MYYIDSPSFTTASAVFTDELLTIKAPDGYYKFGTAYRQQLNGLLLNNVECTACIDCKEFVSFVYRTGTQSETTSRTLSYIDCWGYPHTLHFNDLPSTYGASLVVDVGSLCVKNDSVQNTGGGLFYANYGNNPACNTATELVQSGICPDASETPTGCDVSCLISELGPFVFIEKSTSNYLENGMVVYSSNSVLDLFPGDDLYYKINYNNIIYGVKISNTGVISELTYCNP